MNPFVEPTVAQPAPIARKAWQAPRKSLSRVAQVAGRVVRFGVAGILCSPTFAAALDINSASLQQLQSIKGIGPKTAQIILDERQRGGNYESLEDLSDRVRGIGPKKAASLLAQGLSAGGAKKPPQLDANQEEHPHQSAKKNSASPAGARSKAATKSSGMR